MQTTIGGAHYYASPSEATKTKGVKEQSQQASPTAESMQRGMDVFHRQRKDDSPSSVYVEPRFELLFVGCACSIRCQTYNLIRSLSILILVTCFAAPLISAGCPSSNLFSLGEAVEPPKALPTESHLTLSAKWDGPAWQDGLPWT